MKKRLSSETRAVLAATVLPGQTNPAGNIHGGEIMKMMDAAAGVAAQKHSRTNVVTARVDELCFKQPVYVGDYVVITAEVIYAGKTSMEVFVTVESQNLTKEDRPRIALTAFFTMVSLDENGRPAPVPELIPEDNAYSQLLYERGRQQYMKSKKRKR